MGLIGLKTGVVVVACGEGAALTTARRASVRMESILKLVRVVVEMDAVNCRCQELGR